MEQYTALRAQHAAAFSILNRRYNTISAVRLATAILALVCLIYYIKINSMVLLLCALALAVVFLVLVRRHHTVAGQRTLAQQLIHINDDELAYLGQGALPFADGCEFSYPAHAYAHDLDFFGKNSLFQHLNRTGTHGGKIALAELLLTLLPQDKIRQNQEAIAELAPKISWRQRLLALARIANDSETAYTGLVRWANTPHRVVADGWRVAAYVLPAVLAGCVLAFVRSQDQLFLNAATGCFILNILLVFSQFNAMNREVSGVGRHHRMVQRYSLALADIETEKCQSPKLTELQNRLFYQTGPASAQIKKLSVLLDQMDSLHNGLAAMLFNGTLMYHLHTFRQLMHWKAAYAAQIPQWLAVLGEWEALNSLANFAANNPDFVFPELNDAYTLDFRGLGHPLIGADKRVANDVSFDDRRFIILTGSNMSGKSTFLRTLGINMVLAGLGGPVCAAQARVHPLPVWVSMRLTDSLSDSESYFFAEVKRLRQIMDAVTEKPCFVLLDEVLRGTNSDDKRSGTVGIIRKMVAQKAIGAIATHDLEVCAVTDAYPDILTNKCFEVETVEGELVFDYRLRDGICHNKSATFLMKKMDII